MADFQTQVSQNQRMLVAFWIAVFSFLVSSTLPQLSALSFHKKIIIILIRIHNQQLE
jgi:hypothetical protein